MTFVSHDHWQRHQRGGPSVPGQLAAAAVVSPIEHALRATAISYSQSACCSVCSRHSVNGRDFIGPFSFSENSPFEFEASEPSVRVWSSVIFHESRCLWKTCAGHDTLCLACVCSCVALSEVLVGPSYSMTQDSYLRFRLIVALGCFADI